jgi:hypothetical protein
LARVQAEYVTLIMKFSTKQPESSNEWNHRRETDRASVAYGISGSHRWNLDVSADCRGRAVALGFTVLGL